MREALEEQADALGMEAMLLRLQRIDPETAARLHPAARQRACIPTAIWLPTT